MSSEENSDYPIPKDNSGATVPNRKLVSSHLQKFEGQSASYSSGVFVTNQNSASRMSKKTEKNSGITSGINSFHLISRMISMNL